MPWASIGRQVMALRNVLINIFVNGHASMKKIEPNDTYIHFYVCMIVTRPRLATDDVITSFINND